MPDTAPPENELTAILDALRRLIRHLRIADRQIEQRLGLSGAQLFILQQLGRGPAQSINELADLTHTHQSSVSVVVSRLVERGLASRKQAAEDARRVELRITAAGQQMLRRSPVTPQARLIAALERMSPAALGKLAPLLEQLVREMGAESEPPSMLFEEDPDKSGTVPRRTVRHGRAAGRQPAGGERRPRP